MVFIVLNAACAAATLSVSDWRTHRV